MKSIYAAFLAVLLSPSIASAQIRFVEQATIDLASTAGAANPEFIGSNPSAVAWNGTDLYAAGFNGGSAARVGIVKVSNALTSPTYGPVFGIFTAPPNSRGYSGLDIQGTRLGAAYDKGSADLLGISAYDLSGLFQWGTNARGSSGCGFDPDFNALGTALGTGLGWATVGSGRRPLNDTATGAVIYSTANGMIVLPSGQGTTWRDIDFNETNGDVYLRQSNDVCKATRTGSNTCSPSVFVNLTDASGIAGQNIAYLNTDFGNFVVFNDRTSTAAGQNYFTVNKVVDAAGISASPDWGTFAPATSVGYYDYSWNSADDTLAVLDFGNRKATIFRALPCVGAGIGSQPSAATVCPGGTATFTMTATGSGTIGYQWRFNTVNLANGGSVTGATSPSLSISSVTGANAGNYDCVVTNACGTATTDSVALTILTADADNDGTPDCADGCPNDPAKIAPGLCGCGVSDADSDSDGTADCLDGCPLDPLKLAPGICGCGVSDVDSDNDGTADCNDGCPADPLKIAPGVCGCGVADTDTDLDGTADCNDGCPVDPLKVAPGVCGCGVADTDTDLDGTADCNDGCPTDPLKIAPGICGCGVSDVDSDNDGTVDCNDGCPNDPLKVAPGICGCGVSDADSDLDGTLDCLDGCPNDPLKVAPGACGCGVVDADTDNDGTADCNDGCPSDPLKITPGQCGCGVVDIDTDGDLVADCIDNCDALANSNQLDLDSDGVGDACDNCAQVSNPGQGDCDGDLQGDACEIANGVPDCNLNGIPDACDLADATSQDLNANTIPDECETNGGTPFCFGYLGCPCGNNAVPGSGQGCRNSTGLGAELLGAGLTSLGADSFSLTVINLPIPGAGSGSALFFQGDAQTNLPFVDGRRCVAGSQIRLGTKAHMTGMSNYPQVGDLPVSVNGLVGGPGARYYQVWYRNPIGLCATGSNISNAVAVIWVP